MLVHLGRRSDLLDPALVEDGDAVAHRQGLVLVVGDEDEGDRRDLALDPLSSICISWRSFRSSAPSGSSSSSTGGLLTSARASATRWRCPPESWDGLRAPRPGSRTIASASSPRARRSRRGDALHAQPVLDVLGDRHVREERVVLEDGVDVALVRRQCVTSRPPSSMRPAFGRSKPAIRRSVVVLPEPGRPEQREELAGRTVSSTPATASRRRSSAAARRHDTAGRRGCLVACCGGLRRTRNHDHCVGCT